MVELACEADPRFEASRLEEGRAKSYSIITIEKVIAPGQGASSGKSSPGRVLEVSLP